MDYAEIKNRLEDKRKMLLYKMENKKEKQETMEHELENIQYILELVDMNHFARGFRHQ